jgi:hypothetical protein
MIGQNILNNLETPSQVVRYLMRSNAIIGEQVRFGEALVGLLLHFSCTWVEKNRLEASI